MLAQLPDIAGSDATALAAYELLSPTVENRFVFNLFDLLLCGVIVLVAWRTWRQAQPDRTWEPRQDPLLLSLAFCSLGASFALGALTTGAVFFFGLHPSDTIVDVLAHVLRTGAWLLLVRAIPQRRQSPSLASALWLPSLTWWLTDAPSRFPASVASVLDVISLALLGILVARFARGSSRAKRIAIFAVLFFLAATVLHLAAAATSKVWISGGLWSLEQFATLFSLFVFALVAGETSHELFDRVFVRLQITFILLASLMTLVIIQLEKTDYLTGIRSRSDQLAKFVRAHVEYFRAQREPLSVVVERPDFLERVAVGFASLPELKVVRVGLEDRVATFEIEDNGRIRRALDVLPVRRWHPSDTDEYFLIHALPVAGSARDRVELYGRRTYLNRHVRTRIVIIFSLFTGMVALSTVMIGLVVGGASATIRQQAREIEESQRRLMQASKLAAIGELAGGVAHEINNPATTILSRASFLLSEERKENAGASDDQREDLQAIVVQAQRIAQITRGLLMFSRPHALDIRPASMAGIVDAALHSVHARMAASGITVINGVRTDLPRVLGDEDALVRVIENLVRNAIDAMPGGGVLEIRAGRDGTRAGRLRLQISDGGAGIPPADLPRIFDPFFTTKEVGKGTGLGLAIVHGIVEEHRGTIAVESQPGAGSRFTIVLPAES